MSVSDIDIEEVQAEIAERRESAEREGPPGVQLSVWELEERMREAMAREAWRMNRLMAD